MSAALSYAGIEVMLQLTGMLECTTEVIHNYWAVVNASLFPWQSSVLVWLIFSGSFSRLTSGSSPVDDSRVELLDGDKKSDRRCFHSTFQGSRVQGEVERISQNSFKQRRSRALWFLWLNYRPVPRELSLPLEHRSHLLNLQWYSTGPTTSWTQPIPRILIKLAVALLKTLPMAKKGDRGDLLQRLARTSLFLSPFPSHNQRKFTRVLGPSSRWDFGHINEAF